MIRYAFDRDEGPELATIDTLLNVGTPDESKMLIHENIAVAIGLPFELRLLFKVYAGTVVAERDAFLPGKPTFLHLDGESGVRTSSDYRYNFAINDDTMNHSFAGTFRA